MTKEQADYVRRCVGKRDGDDLERANATFLGLTDAQLVEQYGMSGKTCREIWEEYISRRTRHEAAYAALDALLVERGL